MTTFNDKESGQTALTVVQAVEIALTPKDCQLNRDNPQLHTRAMAVRQERMIAELVATLRDNHTFNDDDVLRLIGRYRFEKA